MDPTAALLAGLVAGIAIAMQIGAVSLLLVEAAVVAGPRAGVAAGMGVATADFGFAAVAAVAGGATGAALASHEAEIRIVAALALAGIAIHGLVGLVRERRAQAGDSPVRVRHPDRARPPGSETGYARPSAPEVLDAAPARRLRGTASGAARAHYARFLAITAANPLTIASFAAVAAALTLDGPVSAATFAAGVGAASAAWHIVLTLAAGHGGRWITPGIRRGLAIGGRLVVLGLAAHLALG